MDIKHIINESIQGYHIPKKGCACGCNTCHLPKSINESVSDNIQSTIDTKIPLKNILKEYIRLSLTENESQILRLEGTLVSDTTERTQADILSDIRSITGVTIVSSQDITPDDTAYNNEFYNSHIKIKIDPHPFIGKGGLGKEQLKHVIIDIKNIKGVRNFKLTKNPTRQTT